MSARSPVRDGGRRTARAKWRRFTKDAGDIAQLAQILGELEDLKATLLLHADDDGAPGEAIDQIHALVQQAQTILQAIVAGEDANTAAIETPLAASAKRLVASFDKTGARNSGADQERIQHVHDTAVDLGATCGTQKSAGGSLVKRLDSLDAVLADLLKRVKNIEAQPLPLPIAGSARAVSKTEDSDANLEKLLADPEALSLLAIKLAQRNGRSFSDALTDHSPTPSCFETSASRAPQHEGFRHCEEL